MENHNSIDLPPYEKHIGWQEVSDEDFEKEFPPRNLNPNKNQKQDKEFSYGES